MPYTARLNAREVKRRDLPAPRHQTAMCSGASYDAGLGNARLRHAAIALWSPRIHTD